MKGRLGRIARGLGLLALLLLGLGTSSLGGAAPDPLLAGAVALAARRKRGFAAPVLGLAGLRAALSIDPVLATLGSFLLLAEGTSLAARTFFGERAFVPGLSASAAALIFSLVRSGWPGGAPTPVLGELLLGAAGTGIVASLAARWVFSAGRPLR